MRNIPYLAGGLFFVFILFALKPVPITSEDKCQEVSGSIKKIYERGEQDVFLILNGNKRQFYINRGLEKGLDLQEMKQKLQDEQVTLKLPRYWTPLDPFNQTRHVAKLEWGSEVLYDETLPAGKE